MSEARRRTTNRNNDNNTITTTPIGNGSTNLHPNIVKDDEYEKDNHFSDTMVIVNARNKKQKKLLLQITIFIIIVFILIYLFMDDNSKHNHFHIKSHNNHNNEILTLDEIEKMNYINSARIKNVISSEKLSPLIQNTIDDIHIVFSTGCSEQQNWQSEVLLYSWAQLQHPGQITRLVSGCKNFDEKLSALKTAIVSERVHYFFAPDFTPKDTGSGNPFHYFNKPYSMQLWLQSVDIAESVIVLVDPDMIITQQFKFHLAEAGEYQVRRGHPVSQKYGIGDKWITWNVCKEESCQIDSKTAWNYYSVGPPYMMHIDDWKLMIDKWVEYSPPALEKDPPPSILAEMYSYAMACAHYGLKHQLIASMLSTLDASASEEPWEEIDWSFETGNDDKEFHNNIYILHYCHGYWLGDDRPSGHLKNAGFNFHKGHLPKDILHNCEIPLLVEPPTNEIGKMMDKDPKKRNVWMLYQVVTRINAALANYKHLYCENWTPTFKTVLSQPEGPTHEMFYYLD